MGLPLRPIPHKNPHKVATYNQSPQTRWQSSSSMPTSKEFRLLESGYSAYHSPISWVPGDLLIEVALFLESRMDILNFCLTVCGSILRSRATIDLSIKVKLQLFQCVLSSLRKGGVKVCRTVHMDSWNARQTGRCCTTCSRARHKPFQSIRFRDRQRHCELCCQESSRGNAFRRLGEILLGCRGVAIP